ncbi:MAG: beta-N-acetylglucosaminidase domain-containing protein [Clostridia bacterium]|nr:beta-N-acetylglucosaminidase domain-containing protein [Clostridia bacterium]
MKQIRSNSIKKQSKKLTAKLIALLLTALLAAGAAAGCHKNSGPEGPTGADKTPVPGGDVDNGGYTDENGVLRIYPRPKSEEIKAETIDAGTLTLEFADGAEADKARYEAALTSAGFNTGTDPAQANLGTDPAQAGAAHVAIRYDTALKSEDYELIVNSDGVQIRAGSAAGGLNAVATLRQLRKGDKLTCATISDAPDTPLRGVIEGFYGTAWTHEFRLDLFRFMGKYKLNTYIYAPKDDAKHRAQWRKMYTGKELEKMQELIDTATANNVNFVYALSPGLDIKLGKGYEEDFQALCDKCGAMYDIGVRYFALLLDDIDSRDAEGHAKLLNDFQTKFIETHAGAADLIAITPEFCTAMLTDYTNKFAPLLNEKIMLMWTGAGVLPSTIPGSNLTAINKIYGSKVFIWWNYPVNDTMADNLFLGPCSGLDKKLSEYVSGLTANPMNQGYASLTPLFTIADFLWNNAGYDGEQSITAAAHLLEPACGDAYKAFVDLQRASTINNNHSEFTVTDELRKYRKGESSAADIDAIVNAFDTLAAQLAELREKGSPELIAEIDSWLAKAEAYAEMGCALFRLEQAAASNADNAAQAELAARYARAKSSIAKNGRIVSPDILTLLFSKTDSRVNEIMGFSTSGDVAAPSASSSLPVYDVYYKENAIDGSENSYFWSSGAPAYGSTFTVDLGQLTPITRVYLHMGAPGHTDDYMRDGVVEHSPDGKSWSTVGKLKGRSFEQEVELETRYLRLRCTKAQTYWLIITEFGADGTFDGISGITLDTATPQELYALADGNLLTAYTTTPASAGSTLRIETNDSARVSLYFTQLDKADNALKIYCENADGSRGPEITPDYLTEVNTSGASALCITFGNSPAALAEVVKE